MYCGHGHDVSTVTQTLRELMRQNINLLDQSEFMRGLNNAFNKSKPYATAVILSFHRITGRLAFSNAGHLPLLWYHAAQLMGFAEPMIRGEESRRMW